MSKLKATAEPFQPPEPPRLRLATLYYTLSICPRQYDTLLTLNYYLTVRRFYELLFLLSYYAHYTVLKGNPGTIKFNFHRRTRPIGPTHPNHIRFEYIDISRIWELAIEWLREIPESWFYGKSSEVALDNLFMVDEGDRTRAWDEASRVWIYLQERTKVALNIESGQTESNQIAMVKIGSIIQSSWITEKSAYPNLSTACADIIFGDNRLLIEDTSSALLSINPSEPFLLEYLKQFESDNELLHVVVEMLFALTEFILKLLDNALRRPSTNKTEAEWKYLGKLYARRRFFALYVSLEAATTVPHRIRRMLHLDHFDPIVDSIWQTAYNEREEFSLGKGDPDKRTCFGVLRRAMEPKEKNTLETTPIDKLLEQSSREPMVNPDPHSFYSKSWPIFILPNGNNVFDKIGRSDCLNRSTGSPYFDSNFPHCQPWYPGWKTFRDWWTYNVPIDITKHKISMRPIHPQALYGAPIRLSDFATRASGVEFNCDSCQETGTIAYYINRCGHIQHWKCLLHRINKEFREDRMNCRQCRQPMFGYSRPLLHWNKIEEVYSDTVF